MPSHLHTIQIMLLEDDATCAHRFKNAIASSPKMQLAAQFSLAGSAIDWLRQQTPEHYPDVFLCDLGLPDQSGLNAIRFCAKTSPRTKILVITMFGDEVHVVKSLEAGAIGYLLKDSLKEQITGHILDLMQGGSPITPIIARYLLNRFQPIASKPPAPAQPSGGTAQDPITAPETLNQLKPRELEILTRIAQGFSYAEIATQTGLSWHTVHSHIKKMYIKLQVHSKSEAVYEARNLGLLIDRSNSRFWG